MLIEAYNCCAARFITLLPTIHLSLFTKKLNKKVRYSISKPNSLFSIAANDNHDNQIKNKISLSFSLFSSGYRGYRCVRNQKHNQSLCKLSSDPRSPYNVVISFNPSVAQQNHILRPGQAKHFFSRKSERDKQHASKQKASKQHCNIVGGKGGAF